MITSAYMLVGGRGSRLSTLFPDSIKSLAPLAGDPLLDHQLRFLKSQGIQKVILLAGFRGDQLQAYPSRSGEFGLKIELAIEEEALGSAGALKRFHHAEDETFLVINGGRYFEGDFSFLLNEKLEPGHLCSALITESVDSSLFRGYPFQAENPKYFLAGALVCHKKILERIPEGRFFLIEEDLLPQLSSLRVLEWAGRVADLAHPHSYAELNADLILKKARRESLVLSTFLSVLLDGGQIYSAGVVEADLWQPFKSWLSVRHIEPKEDMRRLTSKDLVVFSHPSLEDLWKCSHRSGVQVLAVTDKKGFDGLVDVAVETKELRSALMSLEKYWKLLSVSKGFVGPHGRPRRPALFLDRDGIVIEDVGYIDDPNQVRLKPEVLPLIEKAQSRNWAVVIVTNQSGLGRGLYGFKTYDRINQEMLKQLAYRGLYVDRVELAPYFEDSDRAFGLMRSSLRKPRPGMFFDVADELGIDLGKSWMIGDRATDLIAAGIAGLEKGFLVKSEKYPGELEKWKQWPLLSRVSWGPSVQYGWPSFD
jgi:D-glycero-D-manno-heptose 1,7-bisphosphate phosphatase